MSATAAGKFRSIRDFPELVDYLGDELDWPIATDDFEEMTFEYSAAELGLDEKTAPKFLEIRRLRPLDKDQPWGIFFIRFDDNKLPVVALRRLLSKLVLNKRSTSNSGDRASWHESDLLLISQTGNLGTQSISFAHFAVNPEKTDLPILKVLGWDDDDTGLKIDCVIETLREKLVWPDDPTDSNAWRTQWRDAFTLKNREVIQSSKEMAERLGQLALSVRTRLREVLAIESEEGPIHKLMSVFKENLISDLDTDSFSDMYAQTIAYGLLSARIINPKANTADAAHTQIPITNPFLRDLMETFLNVGGRSQGSGVALDFDELGVNEVVDLLDNTKMEAVLRDFGDRNQKEDPVMHFFEGFLQEYDSKIRKDRGVFYTPQPVVSFIVRSVDEQLRTEFGLEDGLADTTSWGEIVKRISGLKIPEGVSENQAFVQILDPATGTGTFPVEVIELIHKTMTSKWQKQGNREAQIKKLWNEYVPEHLLPRLHGYELMMAPYAIAHMKIGLKLYETGYLFKSDQRASIYLTNALEPAQDFSGTFNFAIPALAHEVAAVNDVKREKRFSVVIGNPPYSPSISEPKWIIRMLECWKKGLNEAKSDLNREEWKFLRFAQHNCSISGAGIVGFIINRDFLDGITKRRMREHLAETFPGQLIVDLNGDVKGNVADANVFDITQGVAITIQSTHAKVPKFRYTSRVGTREQKYKDLISKNASDLSSVNIQPQSPYFRWCEDGSVNSREFEAEYSSWPDIKSAFSVCSSGIQSKRDGLCVAFSSDDIWNSVQLFNSLSTETARKEFALGDDGRDWGVKLAQDDIASGGPNEKFISPILYRPFDTRFTYWTGKTKGFIAYPRKEVMQHVIGQKNVGMIFNRQIAGSSVSHFCVSRIPICHGTFYLGNKGQDYFAPLYVYGEDLLGSKSSRQTNFTQSIMRKVKNALCPSSGAVKPEELFNYAYAVFHSPTYRVRYAEFLKMDFPRFPLTKKATLFRELNRLGRMLVCSHLMEAEVTSKPRPSFFGLNHIVSKVGWTKDNGGTVWIDGIGSRSVFNQGTSGFSPVPETVWNFYIGGYQVSEKWLKDRGPKKGRPGRKLTAFDIEHYQKIIIVISETIRIMAEIDDVISLHGGWPGAFITADHL